MATAMFPGTPIRSATNTTGVAERQRLITASAATARAEIDRAAMT
jgi:hypothetical protein